MKIKNLILSILFLAVVLIGFKVNVFAEDIYTDNVIPAMTSATSPSGVVTTNSEDKAEGFPAYKAFDRDVKTMWYTYPTTWASTGNQFICYDFGENNKKKISKITITSGSQAPGMFSLKNFVFQGSNDGTTFRDLYSGTQPDIGSKCEYTFNNDESYRYYKLLCKDSYTSLIAISEMEMMEKITTPVLNTTVANPQSLTGTEFTTTFALHNATNIYAEDIKVNYDSNLFDFVRAEPAKDGYQIFNQDSSTLGKLRFIVANKGEANGITGDAPVLKLTFKAKSTIGKGRIEPRYGLIANGLDGTETQTTCVGTEITVIGGNADVNKDGKFTLGDLAIDSRHYNMDKTKWDTKYNVDIVVNDKVDDEDLKAVVASMLSSN